MKNVPVFRPKEAGKYVVVHRIHTKAM